MFFFSKVYNAGHPIDGGDSMEEDDQDFYEIRLARPVLELNGRPLVQNE